MASTMRRLLQGKIHRATVTHADLDYDGSLTVDRTLMEAAGLVPYEKVHIWNVTRGTRLSTYVIEGEADSGVICANGAAAHHIRPGDLVIIAAFCDVPAEAISEHRPKVVLVDEHNRIRSVSRAVVGGPVGVVQAGAAA